MIGVLRFLQHAPVELQPGEFAVDEAVRIAAEPASAPSPSADEFASGPVSVRS